MNTLLQGENEIHLVILSIDESINKRKLDLTIETKVFYSISVDSKTKFESSLMNTLSYNLSSIVICSDEPEYFHELADNILINNEKYDTITIALDDDDCSDLDFIVSFYIISSTFVDKKRYQCIVIVDDKLCYTQKIIELIKYRLN